MASETGVLIGARIKALRERQGKSQAELARALGASLNGMNYLESGGHTPHIDRLIALAEIFAVSLDYLCGLTEDPQPRRRRRLKEADDKEAAA
jgi:transcriptional regulator with XRE-family HTH domain